MRRPSTVLSRLVAGLAAAAVLTGTLGVSSPAPAEAAACVNGWREVKTPESVFLSTAFDIVTRGGKEAWIVGGTNQGVLALRWTGSRWKRSAGATTGHRGLVGAASNGNRRLLGVGYYRPFLGNGQGSLRPISGKVVVDAWKGIAVPDLPGPRASLTDIIALSGGRAMAVGTRLQNGKLRATAMVYNGRRWSRSDPWRGSGSGLLGINRAGSKGQIWAVGWKESIPGRPRPYIVKRVSGKWKAVKVSGIPAGNGVLTDVHFRGANRGVAVGYLAEVGTDQHRVFALRWNGKAWNKIDLPWAEDFAALPRSVSMGRDGTIWIAGTKTANDNREPRGFIANGKGGTWRVSSLGTPNDIRSEVMAVAATDKGAVAAATVGASLLALKACGENVPSSAISIAGTKRGQTTRRQLDVSRIADRRASQLQDQEYLHEHHDPDADVRVADEPGSDDAFSISGDGDEALALAASPVKHPAFWVKDVAKATGLYQWTKTYDGFAADMDGNGWKDVFYSRHGGVLPRLAMNSGGTFTKAAPGAFSSVDRHGCERGDIDGDGHKDILCAVGASRGKAMKRHELSLKPHRSGRELVIGALGVSDPLGRGRHAAVFRLDNDKYSEVFITNAADRDDGWPGYNRFYRNVGGTLVPAPEVGLDSSHGAECVATGDFDGDGDQDLAYCTQYGFAGRDPGLRFMRNENGTLRDRTLGQRIRQIGDIDVAFADVTGDRKKDLIQLAPNRLRVSKWTKGGYRRIYEVKITDAWALAAGDASGDGRADIYVVRGNDKRNKPDRLLVSRNGGTKFASVKIPTTSKGSADDVIALDHDKNGLTDFVVLNGRTKSGPIQLLASFPRK
ncbi:MAG: VCBS repeat-containing protein [Candidatus Limnocylindrales bacterium]